MLGGLQAELDGEAAGSPLPKKAAALLCYLCITGRSHTRSALASLLWGESPEEAARLGLRTALWSMGDGFRRHLVVTRQTIAFDLASDFRADAVDFARSVTAVLGATLSRAEPTPEQIAQLERAMELFRGEFLAGWPVQRAPAFDDWLMQERQRLTDLALRALNLLALHYARQGAYEQAIAAARRILVLEPWQEETHRLLMQLLTLAGRRSEALMQYRACRRLLIVELGTEPGQETQSLYRDLLATRRRAAAVHTEPGRLQPRQPDRPRTLIGRSRESALARRLLLEPDTRVLTITGPGGAGKSALARAVGEESAEDFADGVWLADLAADEDSAPRPNVPPGDRLAYALARAIGLGSRSRPGLAARVMAGLAHWQALLILDGFEPCLGGERLISQLLAASPRLKVAVTCRRPLALRQERLMWLGGLELPAPPGEAHPEDLLAAPAMQLLAARLSRGADAIPLAGENLAAAADLCHTAAGLPLALELAAVVAADAGLAAVAQCMRHTPEQIAAAWPDAPARQRNLLASFRYSLQWLSADERAALSRLAALAATDGPVALPEALAAGVAPAALRGLAANSLLERLPDGRYAWAPFVRRFTRLETTG
jgi:DNA-binding SARP family transcriptional activator